MSRKDGSGKRRGRQEPTVGEVAADLVSGEEVAEACPIAEEVLVVPVPGWVNRGSEMVWRRGYDRGYRDGLRAGIKIGLASTKKKEVAEADGKGQ